MALVALAKWRLVLEAATVLWNRFRDDVPQKDRQRLGALVRASKGDPRRLTPDERRELLAIIRRVDVGRLGHDLARIMPGRRLLRR